MIIQSLPATVSLFVPIAAPIVTSILIVQSGPGAVQVQAKVVEG